MDEYTKQLENANERLTKIAEENSELSDLFKYVLSKSTMEVVLDGSGSYTITFNGNMVQNQNDHRVKDFAKQFKNFVMKDSNTKKGTPK